MRVAFGGSFLLDGHQNAARFTERFRCVVGRAAAAAGFEKRLRTGTEFSLGGHVPGADVRLQRWEGLLTDQVLGSSNGEKIRGISYANGSVEH